MELFPQDFLPPLGDLFGVKDTSSDDIVLEIITYGGSIPMQRSSLGYQTLRIADLKGSESEAETWAVCEAACVESATPCAGAGQCCAGH